MFDFPLSNVWSILNRPANLQVLKPPGDSALLSTSRQVSKITEDCFLNLTKCSLFSIQRDLVDNYFFILHPDFYCRSRKINVNGLVLTNEAPITNTCMQYG